MSLVNKFFSIIESSICVPKDLGSVANETPVPKSPLELEPEQLFKKISNIKKKQKFLFIIFKFKAEIVDYFFWDFFIREFFDYIFNAFIF